MAPHSLSALCLLAVLGAVAAAQDAPAPPAADPAAAPAAQQAPRPALSTMWDGALADSANGTPFDQTDGYRKLLTTLRQMPDTEAATHSAVQLDYPRALSDPDSLRGEWVKVRGLVGQLDAERLDQPLSGAVDAWRGWVADTDGHSEGVVFDILGRPTGIELDRDLVDVEGVLYRTVSYETRHGATNVVPWILARSVTKVNEAALPREGVADIWALVLIGLAVAFIVMRVVQLARQQKRGDNRHRLDHGDLIRKAARVSHRPPAKPGATPSTPTTPTPTDSP